MVDRSKFLELYFTMVKSASQKPFLYRNAPKRWESDAIANFVDCETEVDGEDLILWVSPNPEADYRSIIDAIGLKKFADKGYKEMYTQGLVARVSPTGEHSCIKFEVYPAWLKFSVHTLNNSGMALKTLYEGMLDYDGRLVIITIDGDINIQNRAGLVDYYMTLSRVYSLASFMPGWSGEFESTTLYERKEIKS